MNLCDFLMGMNLSGGSGGGGGDPETKAIVDNAVENHGIGTVYTETILAPVTVAPGDWDANNRYTLTGVALDLVLGETYRVSVNGTTYNVAAVEVGGEIGLPLMDLGIAVIAGSEGPPATDPYIFAFQGTPAESMTFSIEQDTINKIDSKFIDPWDFVLFIDNASNASPVVIKGEQEAIVEQLKGPNPMIKAFVFARYPGVETGQYVYSQGLPQLNLYASDAPDTYDSVVVVPCTPLSNMALDDTPWCWFPDGTWEKL